MALLDSPEFCEAWQMWHQHRKEIKKKITPTAEKLQLKKLESWGERKAIVAINRSIENGWQGLFEPQEKDLPPVKTELKPVNNPPFVPEPVTFTAEQQRENMRRLREMCRSGGLL